MGDIYPLSLTIVALVLSFFIAVWIAYVKWAVQGINDQPRGRLYFTFGSLILVLLIGLALIVNALFEYLNELSTQYILIIWLTIAVPSSLILCWWFIT